MDRDTLLREFREWEIKEKKLRRKPRKSKSAAYHSKFDDSDDFDASRIIWPPFCGLIARRCTKSKIGCVTSCVYRKDFTTQHLLSTLKELQAAIIG